MNLKLEHDDIVHHLQALATQTEIMSRGGSTCYYQIRTYRTRQGL